MHCFDEDDSTRFVTVACRMARDVIALGEHEDLCPFCTVSVALGAAAFLSVNGQPQLDIDRDRFLKIAAFMYGLMVADREGSAVH